MVSWSSWANRISSPGLRTAVAAGRTARRRATSRPRPARGVLIRCAGERHAAWLGREGPVGGGGGGKRLDSSTRIQALHFCGAEHLCDGFHGCISGALRNLETETDQRIPPTAACGARGSQEHLPSSPKRHRPVKRQASSRDGKQLLGRFGLLSGNFRPEHTLRASPATDRLVPDSPVLFQLIF